MNQGKSQAKLAQFFNQLSYSNQLLAYCLLSAVANGISSSLPMSTKIITNKTTCEGFLIHEFL